MFQELVFHRDLAVAAGKSQTTAAATFLMIDAYAISPLGQDLSGIFTHSDPPPSLTDADAQSQVRPSSIGFGE